MRVACVLFVLSASVTVAENASSGTPVERVVKLLEELKDKIEMDSKEDARIYAKFACWCEKTSKRKAAAIEEAQMKLRELGQSILKFKGLIATRKAEIAQLKEEIAEIEKAIEELTATRQKENQEFMAASTELMQAQAALEKAIIVLHNATKQSFLQGASATGSEWRRAALGVQAAVAAMPDSAALSPDQATKVTAFLQGASTAGARAGYAPQSATVQGILKDMYDTFASDLETLTSDEATKNRQFEDIVYLKSKEKAEKEALVAKKEKELAEAEVSLADAQTLFDETEAQMNADIEFFDALLKSCNAKFEEYQIRKAEHEDELKGILEALKILTSDEAREIFAKSIKPGLEVSFLQFGSVAAGSAAEIAAGKAYRALKAQATTARSLGLASLAAAVRAADVGHFDKVIEKIDEMIQVLKDEEQSDIAKRDECKDEYTKSASDIAQLEWEIEKNLAKIHKLESLIKMREEEKIEALHQIVVTKEDINQMEEQRKEENAAFLEAKSDDEAAIELLEAAKKALGAYYKKEKIELGPIQGSIKGVDLAQQPEFRISEDQAPDATFSHKGSRKGESKGAISILTMIIEDLHAEIASGIKAEAKMQADFEESLAAAKKRVEELEDQVAELTELIAQRKEDWTNEHETMKENNHSLDEEKKYKKEITPDCDWILNAFEERRTKRKAEAGALVEAKEYLAGAAPAASDGVMEIQLGNGLLRGRR